MLDQHIPVFPLSFLSSLKANKGKPAFSSKCARIRITLRFGLFISSERKSKYQSSSSAAAEAEVELWFGG